MLSKVVRASVLWLVLKLHKLYNKLLWGHLDAGALLYSGATFALPPFSAPSDGNPGPREEARRKRSFAISPASKVRLSTGGSASRGTPGWRSLAFHSSVNLSGSDVVRVSVRSRRAGLGREQYWKEGRDALASLALAGCCERYHLGSSFSHFAQPSSSHARTWSLGGHTQTAKSTTSAREPSGPSPKVHPPLSVHAHWMSVFNDLCCGCWLFGCQV